MSADYDCSEVGARLDERIAINNASESPFGTGWSLAGLQRLHIQDDGRIVIDGGDGSLGELR